MARVIKFVMESAAEAEIASLFINAKAAISIKKKYTNRTKSGIHKHKHKLKLKSKQII